MSNEYPMQKPVLCPVCDSPESKQLYQPWVHENDPSKLYGAASGIPGTQTIVGCSVCEMIYESPRYDAATIIKGYEASEESGHDSQYPMRVDSFYRSLKSLSGKIPAVGSKVLDIGTAGGAFLDAATKYGYDAYGMEPSHYLVDKGCERGLQIRQGTIESHTFEPNSFDMITLWDVIEHLPDPKFALKETRKLLKPDGVLLINYPDIGTLQAKMAGKRFWWILSVHLHHFSRDTIEKICDKTGFSTTYFQRYWQRLQFGYLLEMAVIYNIPTAKFFCRYMPKFIQQITIPYYASQTTALASIK
jgi:2-polyprenyl-3-methyl-5-hydroxy-6-metoxy-1,4-benzoquinol methylase